jgi:tetrahydromethanopterin S-methyltransferase subunit D
MKFTYYHVTLIKENFINFVVNTYSIGGKYENLDKKMKQPPSGTIYGKIYT